MEVGKLYRYIDGYDFVFKCVGKGSSWDNILILLAPLEDIGYQGNTYSVVWKSTEYKEL